MVDRVVLIGSYATKCMELGARNRVYVNANKSFDPVLRNSIYNRLWWDLTMFSQKSSQN